MCGTALFNQALAAPVKIAESQITGSFSSSYNGLSEDGQTSYIYYVDENETISAANQDVTFTGHSSGWALFENYGTVTDLHSLTVTDGVFNNGYELRNGKGTPKGDNATLEIADKLTITASVGGYLNNYGTIKAGSFEITGKENYTFNNAKNAQLIISSGNINGSIDNYGSIKVGAGRTAVFNGLKMRAGSTFTDINGNPVDVILDTTHEENTDNVEIYNTQSDNLTFKSLSTSGEGISLRIKENAYLTILNDVDLYKDEGDVSGSNLYSESDSVLNVGGTLAVGNLAKGNGTITAENLLVNVGSISETGSLTVNGLMTVTTNFASHSADSFHVKNLRTDNSYTGDRVYVPLHNGHYQFDNLILGGGFDDSDKAGAYSGVQLFNSDLTVASVMVESGTNGMISFYENKTDGSALTASIDNLYVEETGTLLLNAQETGQNNIMDVNSATFATDSVIKGKADSHDINLQIKTMTADSLSFEKLSDNSQVRIGTAALSGSNNFAQKIMGMKNNGTVETLLSLSLNDNAQAAFNEVDTNYLQVRLKDLQGAGQFTINDLQNCPTCKNVHFAVDGKANNAAADDVVAKLKDSINIQTITDGTAVAHEYEADIEEGNIYGAIHVGCDGSYTVNENKKLDSIAESTAVSYMQWRLESDDIYKRLGELRGNNAENGIWVRTYGGSTEYGDQNVDTDFVSVQLGYDKVVGNKYGPVHVGAALSYTDGDSDFDTGDGSFDTYAMTLYASFILDNDWFIDTTFKYGMLENDYDINYRSFKYHGDFDTYAFALSAEVGKRFNLSENFFLEPQVQATFSQVRGEKYSTSNGISVDQDDFNSFITRAGLMAGMNFADNRGMAYFRASYLYDFDGDLSTYFADANGAHTVDQDLSGGWCELDLGVDFNFTEALSGYAELEYADGEEFESPFRWNAGIRYSF